MRRGGTPQAGSLPVLIVGTDRLVVAKLADELGREGFEADSTTPDQVVHPADYGVLVVFTNLSEAGEVAWVADVRKQAPRTWIIVIGSRMQSDAQRIVFQCGADAWITAPFALEDLIFRLSAFSRRSRPP